jgi:hypothetical protein
MASETGLYNKNSQNTVPAPPGYTRLTDAGGQIYLVPDFILPAAKFSETIEDKKASIDVSRTRPGVNIFSLSFCRKVAASVARLCRS